LVGVRSTPTAVMSGQAAFGGQSNGPQFVAIFVIFVV
jgi:hypothetical protein